MAPSARSSDQSKLLAVIFGLVALMAVLIATVHPTADQKAAAPKLDEPPSVDQPPSAADATLPQAPFALPAPPEPPAQLRGVDLRTDDPQLLWQGAHIAASRGEWDMAVQLQHWAVARGQDGQYDLACDYARVRQVDAAIYWLQRAAIEEGADADWAGRDEDLAAVRADRRWPEVRAFLVRATRYWVARGVTQTLLVVPTGYTKDRAIPAVVGLHGRGSRPEDLAGPWAQGAADALGVAFVSVSGTVSFGLHKFRWAESAARDAARVEAALAEVRDRLTVAEGKIVLVGFSQGAQMSAEIAARNPGRFAGAIVMSPGTSADLALQDVAPSAALAGHRFVVVAGAGQHPATVARAEADAARLRALGAEVFQKAYADQNTHAFPPDFEEALPGWVRFILGTGPKP